MPKKHMKLFYFEIIIFRNHRSSAAGKKEKNRAAFDFTGNADKLSVDAFIFALFARFIIIYRSHPSSARTTSAIRWQISSSCPCSGPSAMTRISGSVPEGRTRMRPLSPSSALSSLRYLSSSRLMVSSMRWPLASSRRHSATMLPLASSFAAATARTAFSLKAMHQLPSW